MSSNIWTQCGGKSNLRRLSLLASRVVEAQHQISTRKLVDSLEEQELLEELIEAAKPRLLPGTERLHWLLSTPFRYPPLRYGSRFGTREQSGIWYGSDGAHAAFAESAYYRFVFRAGTAARLPMMTLELTAFQVKLASARAVDLGRPPFAELESAISSKTSYEEAQALGLAMREAGVELFRYVSARDPLRGTNVGLFSPAPFGARRPAGLSVWFCTHDDDVVEFVAKNTLKKQAFVFRREHFEVDGRLPAPAV
jgi:hypothetical protein